jgi:predicted transcriptional regulator YdeE
MNVVVVELAGKHLVGLESMGPNDQGEIPALWHAYIPRMGEIPGVKDAFGVARRGDDGGLESYMVASEVDSFDVIPEGMVAWEMAGGLFAEIELAFLAEMETRMRQFDEEWLPTSPYRRAWGHLESYPPTFSPSDERFTVRIALRERIA